jgi:putative ABC transport system permease protein
VGAGAVLGASLTYGALAILQPLIDKRYGLYLEFGLPGASDLTALMVVLLGGIVAGLLPAWRAYRLSLADGMTVRT